MISDQLKLDLNRKTAFIGNCFCLFNLDIETSGQIIQQLVHAKIGSTILPHIKAIVPIHHLDIPNLRDFIFSAI